MFTTVYQQQMEWAQQIIALAIKLMLYLSRNNKIFQFKHVT